MDKLKTEYHDLSPSQIPEWYAYQLDPESPVYNISFNHFFFDNINPDFFVEAWQRIMHRHTIFRMRFTYFNDRPVQFLGPSIELKLADIYIDRRHLSSHTIENEQNNLAEKFSLFSFNFEEGPLFKLHLVAYPQQQYQLIFTIHHIIWDETSTINLIKEFVEIYNSLFERRPAKLAELKADYFTYVQWINQSIADGTFDRHKYYWLDLYKTVPPPLRLPEDLPRPAIQTYNGETIVKWLPRKLIMNAQNYMYENNITLFMLLLAVLNLYFYRYTGQDDFVLGCPIAGRNRADFKSLLGCFAVPIPMRCQIQENMTFPQLIAQVKARTLEAFEHHLYPCNQLIEQLHHTNDLSRPKLFSVMAGIQNNKTDLLSVKLGEGSLYAKDIYAAENHGARFDLAIGLDPLGSDIKFFCTYNTDLFHKKTIERMLEYIINLFESVLKDPVKKLAEYSLLSENDRKKIWLGFNNTDKFFPQDVTLSSIFERQVELYPDYIALVCEEGSLTYQELNKRANQLAYYLEKRGLGSNHTIGIMQEPGLQMIIAIFAILKLGACYVPISPTSSIDRIINILSASFVQYVLSENRFGSVYPSLSQKFIFQDQENTIIQQQNGHNFKSNVSSESLAYIVYTSGTTGIPKGIPIAHRGVINLLTAVQDRYQLEKGQSILFLSPFTFDASILEIFWPLAFGGRIVIPNPAMHKEPAYIGRLLADYQVNFFQTVPTMLNALCDEKTAHRLPDLPGLKLIICGGAVMTRSLRDLVLQMFPCQLANHYGPTEITVDAAWFNCREDFHGDNVPLGKPLPNVKIFILDEYRHSVPIGATGEIYIASPGMTPGYLKDPTRNEQMFIHHQFNEHGPLIRLYRTGDLGSYDEEGTIYFCGRRDNQIKIDGNRIELDDIKSILEKHPLVSKTVVKYYQDIRSIHRGKLVAFIEPKQGIINRLQAKQGHYYQFTLAQRPQLLHAMTTAHLDVWPKYFAGSPAIKKYWPQVCVEFPEYQFCLLNEEGRVAAVCNGIPCYWDGSLKNLPEGWDAGIELAFKQALQGIKPNTVLGLTGIVTDEFQGLGLSGQIVQAFRGLARMHGLTQFLGPVRPVGMLEYKTYDFVDWAQKVDENGEPFDYWLRTHQRAGAKILRLAPKSQYIKGTLDQWREWTGQIWNQSGEYYLPDALQPVTVDIEKNLGYYYDPSIWVGHYDLDKAYGTHLHLTSDSFRSYLVENLPSYMVPQQYYILAQMPLTDSGKINSFALPQPDLTTIHGIKPAKNALQQSLVECWQEVLKIDLIGVTDDFFLLGGQSLQVIQMLVKIEKLFDVKIPLKIFYRSPTIESLAVKLEEFINSESTIIV